MDGILGARRDFQRTVYLHLKRPSSFLSFKPQSFDRPVYVPNTVKFSPLLSSTFGLWGQSLLQIVHFNSFEPSSCKHERPLLIVWTVLFYLHEWSTSIKGRPIQTWPYKRTVLFLISRRPVLSKIGVFCESCLISAFWALQLTSRGRYIFIYDRPLSN